MFTDFTDYLKLEKNYSVHTIKAYTDDLIQFSDFVGEEFSLQEIKSVNYSIIRSWIVHLVNHDLTNRSVNRKISSLQAYYNYLLKTKQIEASPLLKHKSLKTSKKVQIPFSEKEMNAIHNLPDPEGFEETRDRLIVELFYSTGIRRSELINIKLNDLQLQSKTLKVRGKGDKDRIIPILPTVSETLKYYLDERKKLEAIKDADFLFLTAKGKQIYEVLVYRIVKNYFKGISTKQKISPHILRHSFATHLLNEGADINAIKELLGHASLSSTQIYTHNDIVSLRKTHAKAHPRNKRD